MEHPATTVTSAPTAAVAGIDISTNSTGFLAQADLGQLIRQQIYKRAKEVDMGAGCA
ncbi:hypothetical protein HaLaN_11884, partial [Haematococcus lacustris]